MFAGSLVPLGSVPIKATRHVPRGQGYMMAGVMVMHWIDAAMLAFDHDAWWEATPAENARRIVQEATAAHVLRT